MIRHLSPLLGTEADILWQSYLVSDPEERLLIRHLLENLYNHYVDDYRSEKILLSPPSTLKQLLGQYPLGEVWYTRPFYPFSLTEKELTQHISIFGRTGAGKSYLVKSLLSHLAKAFLVFDWKGTYRDTGSPIITLGNDFRFNPLDLNHIAPSHQSTYLRQIIELFIDCYLEDLRLLTVQGVEYLLLLTIEKLPSPTFQSIYKSLKSYSSTFREMDWKISALSILFKLISGPLGKVMRNPSVEIAQLVKQQTIFELNNVGSSKDKSFFIRSLLLRIYYHFEKQGPSNALQLFIVLEEAHNILLKKGGHETIIELMLRQIREFGVGICIVDQHPSLISLPALATYCTVAFNLGLKQDRDAMASALCLDQTDYLGKLPPRYAITKIQDRMLTPFLIRTYDFLPQKDATKTSKVIRDVMMKDEDIRGFNEVIRAQSEVVRVIRQEAKGREAPLFWEEVFLVHIYVYPLMSTVKRYRQLGLNSYQGNKHKDSLLHKGFILLEPVPTPSGRIKLMVPTQKGFDWLKSRGFFTRCDKHGGLMHQYWKRRLHDQLQKRGYSTKLEANLGTGSIDLLVGGKVAVEIETGKNSYEQVFRNLQKSDHVVAFILNAAMAKRLLSQTDQVVVSEERDCITEVMRLLGDTE